MKSRKKNIWAWIGGVLLILLIVGGVIGKTVFRGFQAKVGSDKSLLVQVVADYYGGKSVDPQVLPDSRTQIHNIFEKAKKEKGNLLAIGMVDTLPSFADGMANGAEISYNLPVQFDKGFMTFTFRVRNNESGPILIWSEVSEGIAEHDNFRNRLRKHLP